MKSQVTPSQSRTPFYCTSAQISLQNSRNKVQSKHKRCQFDHYVKKTHKSFDISELSHQRTNQPKLCKDNASVKENEKKAKGRRLSMVTEMNKLQREQNSSKFVGVKEEKKICSQGQMLNHPSPQINEVSNAGQNDMNAVNVSEKEMIKKKLNHHIYLKVESVQRIDAGCNTSNQVGIQTGPEIHSIGINTDQLQKAVSTVVPRQARNSRLLSCIKQTDQELSAALENLTLKHESVNILRSTINTQLIEIPQDQNIRELQTSFFVAKITQQQEIIKDQEGTLQQCQTKIAELEASTQIDRRAMLQNGRLRQQVSLLQKQNELLKRCLKK